MTEYIDKYEVGAKIQMMYIRREMDYGGENDFCRGMRKALRIIENTPATDVQSVKHGYWEEVTDYGGWGDTHYRCSVCGEEWYLEDGKPKDNNMNFCPRCGARMDGEQNENN